MYEDRKNDFQLFSPRALNYQNWDPWLIIIQI